jgi:hypothetical protein
MKDSRNFIIINSDNFIITATFANCSSEVLYKKHKREYPAKKHIINNIDILKIINKQMAQILKWKEEEKALSTYYILLPSKLCKIIKDKLYKQWLDTGKTNSGYNLKKEELEQWQIFQTLYKKIFANIVFKPNNLYSSNDANKTYRHVTFTKNVVDKMHNYLDKLEDSIKVKTLEDLLKYN